MNPRKSSFELVADHRTRVLVLGSLPGEKSLAARQYYGNPANQFWRLVGAVIEIDLASLAYGHRLERLLANGIGLWDTIADAERPGSLDTRIRSHRPNQFAGLTDSLPGLRGLAFNGGKSAKTGRKALPPDSGLELIDLPSSSAAYCSISFAQKLEKWKLLRELLA